MTSFFAASVEGVGNMKRRQPQGFFALFVSLLTFWMLVSQSIDLQHLIVGIPFALLITYYWKESLIDIANRHDLFPSRFLLTTRTVRYMADLLKDIVKGNFNIARIVLTPSLPISPVFFCIRTRLRTDLMRTVYANSITLTPGTITVSLNGDQMVVHALTHAVALEVADWKVEQDLMEIEGDIGRA